MLLRRAKRLSNSICAGELAIVADGRDMAEIGLMRDIAQRTLA